MVNFVALPSTGLRGCSDKQLSAPYRYSGVDRQVFHLEQRSIGSLLLWESDRTRCISCPDFQNRHGNEQFRLAFSPLLSFSKESIRAPTIADGNALRR